MNNTNDSTPTAGTSGSQLLEIRQRAVKIHEEGLQILADAMHWNECVRKEDEEPINPDPDGSIERTISHTGDLILQIDEKLCALLAENI